MDKPKGGRGCKVPYQTKQVRIPIPLEPQVQELISRYHNWVSGDVLASDPPCLLDVPQAKPVYELNLISNKPDYKLDVQASKPVNSLNAKNGDDGISQLALAQRLGCSDRYLRKLSKQGKLAEWSRKKDPQGFSWELIDRKCYSSFVVDKVAG